MAQKSNEFNTSKCRHFSGYKPCAHQLSRPQHDLECDQNCPHLDIPKSRILLVHLGALGAVVRSTALLPALKRKYPGSHLTWLTQTPADQILKGIDSIDRIVTLNQAECLKVLNFDVVMCLDKSAEACAIAQQIQTKQYYGFKLDADSGSILPATTEAHELWQIGISNQKKFFENKKSEAQLNHEALALGLYLREPPRLVLSLEEERQAGTRSKTWRQAEEILIGFNTGCAPTIAAKKLTVDGHVRLAQELVRQAQQMKLKIRVVLLGGREDQGRNQEIAEKLGQSSIPFVESPYQLGIRDGMTSIKACDVIITGDSFGMHLATGLNTPVVAWFGPTCAHEIDFYDSGAAVLTQADCSPCWKRSCSKNIMCYDQINWTEFAGKVYSVYRDHASANSLLGRHNLNDTSRAEAQV